MVSLVCGEAARSEQDGDFKLVLAGELGKASTITRPFRHKYGEKIRKCEYPNPSL